MAFVGLEPLRNLARMQDEMARLLRDAFESVEAGTTSTTAGLWAPPVDIIEHGDDLVLVADLPGVSRDDIDISVENRTLTLSGERKPPEEYQDSTVYRTERAYGKFTRTFALPASVDVSRITAEYHDGVLRVILPKAEEARPRKIEIRS